MGLFDKVKDIVKGNEKVVDTAIDKAGDQIDKATGDKYKDAVDKAQNAAKGFLHQDDQGTQQESKK